MRGEDDTSRDQGPINTPSSKGRGRHFYSMSVNDKCQWIAIVAIWVTMAINFIRVLEHIGFYEKPKK